MAENDPDKLKGPGGLTLRQIHQQVQKSVARDKEAQENEKPARSEAGPLAALRTLRLGQKARLV